MKSLNEIIANNARVAGREAGHADTDEKDRLATEIIATDTHDSQSLEHLWFVTGYLQGRSEG